MVVWKIEGDAIGNNDASAQFCETKRKAEFELRAYSEWCKERGKYNASNGPFKVTIKDRRDLVAALNSAMGHGGQ